MIENIILEQIYLEFLNFVYQDKTYKIVSFKKDKIIDNWENYKYKVRELARENLMSSRWKIDNIGKGEILKNIKDAINTHIDYNGKRIDNNLIDWRKKDNFSNLKQDKKLEKILFNFFKSKEKDDGKSFNYFMEIGLSYQMIAYLFFIKDHNKYLPISQERFDFIFKEANIDFKTSGKLSWENYLQYNSIIKNVQQFLKSKKIETNLLDAHSFLWIWGWMKKEIIDNIENETQNDIQAEKTENEDKNIIQENDTAESYANLDDDFFVEKLRSQMEKGHEAENIALKFEKEKLIKAGRKDLAEKVELVAGKIGLGYDILSYEADSEKDIIMQIEVKSVNSGKNKRFFITRNELNKSRLLSNYYIFLVENASSEKPNIIQIKQPNLFDKDKFELETVSYEVKYKTQ